MAGAGGYVRRRWPRRSWTAPLLAALVREQVGKDLAAAGHPPVCLATVLVGDDGPSQRYVASKQKQAAEIGMLSRHIDLPATATPGRGRSRRRRPGRRPRRCTASSSSCRCPRAGRRSGHRPHPAGQGRRRAHGRQPRAPRAGCTRPRALHAARRDEAARAPRRARAPAREPSCSAAPRSSGSPWPCCSPPRAPTPRSRSPTPARPTCPALLRQADIIVSAVGVARIVTADCVKPGAAVVDVGISRTEAGIVGDVDFDAVRRGRRLGDARCPAAPGR